MMLERTCTECGKPFAYPYRNGRQRKTCSERCRLARRKRQYGDFHKRRQLQLPRCPTCGGVMLQITTSEN
jgi:endogenous inhibitor of DNA gyrase (YacG/DUF329 family)